MINGVYCTESVHYNVDHRGLLHPEPSTFNITGLRCTWSQQ